MRKYSYRFDVYRNLSGAELSFDGGFHRVRELGRRFHRRTARDRNRHVGEELTGCSRARAYGAHVTNLGHAKNDASQLPSIDRSLVHENRDRLLENLDSAPRDDESNGDGEPRIESPKADM